MGGEKVLYPLFMMIGVGSPPRGRGKVCCSSIALICAGITPAWAGKRYDQLGRRAEGQDHPRVGGEKQGAQVLGGFGLGSPPRWRGKAVKFRFTCGLQRITPAWAGKRTLHRFHRLACRDHPRMGGEKAQVLPAGISSEGSPPRGRGKGVSNVLVPEKFGITPAWAGKSTSGGRVLLTAADHPRMGGEKPSFLVVFSRRLGSPPHGRGKVAAIAAAIAIIGITPAWAGKRPRVSGYFLPTGDHPRMGGEKAFQSKTNRQNMGSPPHGRGKEERRKARETGLRITPAWAGKRNLDNEILGKRQDHPRMGGEK